MPRFPAWEGSSLNLKRPQNAPTDITGLSSTFRQDDLDSLPILPLLQNMTSEQSFLDTFQSMSKQSFTGDEIVTRAAIDTDSAVTSASLLLNTGAYRATSSAAVRLASSRSPISSEGSDAHYSRPHTISPIRQMSDSSRTSHSKQSDTFSDQSRPSSRSSNEDSIGPTRQCLEPMLSIASGGGPPQKRHRSHSKSTLLAPKPANPPQSLRSSSLPSTVVQDKKPQPPQQPTLGGLSQSRSSARPLSTMVLASGVSKPKRGARLGRQMMGRYSEASEPPHMTTKTGSRKVLTRRHEGHTYRNSTMEPDDEFNVSEKVLLGILSNIRSLRDLRSAAMVNKEFYSIFRRHERHLVSTVLLAVSVPAWELRQIMFSEQKRSAFKLRSLQRDVQTVRALQSFILMKCESTCRASTIDALMDETSPRRAELDDAMWRIWIFCKLFGKHRGLVELRAQMLWLRGGHQKEHRASRDAMSSIGCGTALSVRELEDISEMWQCLEILLAGFRGRELDARKAGVFDNCVIDTDNSQTEQTLLDMWIYDILSLGPKAVLTLSSCSFEQARVLGITRWTPPADGHGRIKFLKTAVEEVYRDQLITEARMKAMEFEREVRQHVKSRRVVSDSLIPSPHDLRRLRTLSLGTPVQSCPQTSEDSTRSQERADVRPDCDPLSPVSPHPSGPINSPTSNPAAFSSLSLTPTASARLGATLFPVHYQTADGTSATATHEQLSNDREFPFASLQVIDPADKALLYLVKDLGHSEAAAKRALAMCDNGRSIDIHQAVELLTAGHVGTPTPGQNATLELPATPIESLSSLGIGDGRGGNQHAGGSNQLLSSQQEVAPGKRSRLKRSSMRKAFPLGVILDTEEGDDSGDEVHSKTAPVSQSIAMTLRKTGPLTRHHNLIEAVRHSMQLSNNSNNNNNDNKRSNHSRKQVQPCNINVDQVESEEKSIAISPSQDGVMPPGAQINMLPHSLGCVEHGNEEVSKSSRRPRAVLTRVGTGKRPSKGWSFREGIKSKEGEPAEIIGYAY